MITAGLNWKLPQLLPQAYPMAIAIARKNPTTVARTMSRTGSEWFAPFIDFRGGSRKGGATEEYAFPCLLVIGCEIGGIILK